MQKVRYRIYTEDLPWFDIDKTLKKYFSGYTVTCARGVYLGEKEPSLVIEYIGMPFDVGVVREAAREIKETNKQDEVWITFEPVMLEVV